MTDEEYAIPTGATIITVNPAVQDSCEQMTYRELQMLAKRIGVNGGGKRSLILNRVRRWNQQIKQDRVTTVNDTLVLHDHEEVSTSLLSPLKSKPRRMDDGTPISILSQKEPEERKPVAGGGSMVQYKQFLKEKSGSISALPSGTCVASLPNAFAAAWPLSQQVSSSRSGSGSPDGKNGEVQAQEEGPNDASLMRTPLEKKKKKRLSFSVFNGVKIIPARAGLPPSPPETYLHLMRHGFIRSDAREAPEGQTEHELQAITLRNTQIATVAGKLPAVEAPECEEPDEQRQQQLEAEAEQREREAQKEAEGQDQGTPQSQKSAKAGDHSKGSSSGKKMHRRRRNRSGRKSQERESQPPATEVLATSSASNLGTYRGSNEERDDEDEEVAQLESRQEDEEQDDKENEPECTQRGEKDKNDKEVEKLSSQLRGTVLTARCAEPSQPRLDDADKENCVRQRLVEKPDGTGNAPNKQLPSARSDKIKLVDAPHQATKTSNVLAHA